MTTYPSLSTLTAIPPMFRLPTLPALVLMVAAACDDSRVQTKGGPAQPSVQDSIRARRNAALAMRPDTMGDRVDSLRILGAPMAATFLVVVSDFQCAECARFARELVPRLRRELVDNGMARLAFVNFPQESHFNARFAAHAALCAGASNHFWAMHDTLFATQAAWARRDDPRPFFDSLAVAVGSDSGTQRECTTRLRMMRLLTSDIERSQSAAVRVVPTLLVGSTALSGADLNLARIRRAVLDARR